MNIFTSVFNNHNDVEHGDKGRMNNENEDKEIEITITEVKAKFKELNALNLEGWDNLHPRIQKEPALEITNPAARIFNKSVKVVPYD